jgi:hypothetical protein
VRHRWLARPEEAAAGRQVVAVGQCAVAWKVVVAGRREPVVREEVAGRRAGVVGRREVAVREEAVGRQVGAVGRQVGAVGRRAEAVALPCHRVQALAAEAERRAHRAQAWGAVVLGQHDHHALA